MKKNKPNPRTLVLVFIAFLAFFISIPPILLKNAVVADFFRVLGQANARLHVLILRGLGIESYASSNLLTLSSGTVAEYSPYCYGFLTISAFIFLTFAVPNLRLADRLKWVSWATLVLLLVNQGRIILELVLAFHFTAGLSTVDRLFYPFLPVVALFIWYRGLKQREQIFSFEGGAHA